MHKNTYHAKTLIGNWEEERSTSNFNGENETSNSDLPNPSYNKYVPISKDIGNNKDYQKGPHDNATDNWMNFQQTFKEDQTFQTTNKETIPELDNRTEKFKLGQNALTKDEQALADYRARWTQGNHCFDRVYLGHEKK